MRKGDLTQRKPTGEIIMTYNLPITMSLITMQAMGMKVVVIVLLSDQPHLASLCQPASNMAVQTGGVTGIGR